MFSILMLIVALHPSYIDGVQHHDQCRMDCDMVSNFFAIFLIPNWQNSLITASWQIIGHCLTPFTLTCQISALVQTQTPEAWGSNPGTGR